MFPLESYCEDNIINISDEVIVIDSSGDLNGSETVISISDTSNADCDSIIVISDESENSSFNSIISISDTSNAECGSAIVISDDSKNSTFPSFDFASSMKMLLPQPRTSTPSFQRIADAAAAAKQNDRECHHNFFVFLYFFTCLSDRKMNRTYFLLFFT